MAKAKFLDFKILDEQEERVVFRFYPRQSNCHVFDISAKNKTWEDVYKIYYAWRINHMTYNSDEVRWIPDRVMDMPCDENSVIQELGAAVRESLNFQQDVDLCTLGQPGSDWKIEYKQMFLDENGELTRDCSKDCLWITVFHNCTNKGYRFKLKRQQAFEFASYIDRVNEHMLKNCEAI